MSLKVKGVFLGGTGVQTSKCVCHGVRRYEEARCCPWY